jgi:hypothetical protein
MCTTGFCRSWTVALSLLNITWLLTFNVEYETVTLNGGSTLMALSLVKKLSRTIFNQKPDVLVSFLKEASRALSHEGCSSFSD